MLLELLDRRAEGWGIAQERSDILEHDARLGKVGNVADIVARSIEAGTVMDEGSRSTATSRANRDRAARSVRSARFAAMGLSLSIMNWLLSSVAPGRMTDDK